jgi:hypothetical protein
MSDIATISAFFGSIKTATELAKAIKGADLSLEKAETKLKMAELISALANAKVQAAEIQDLLQEKDERIKNLEKTLKTKSQLIHHDGIYYETNADGNTVGEPYCPQCFEVDNIVVHLKNIKEQYYYCTNCQNNYGELPDSLKQNPRKSVSYYTD